jgi:hypothetical protein
MRRTATLGIFASAVVLGIVMYMPAVQGQANPGESEVQRGLDITPVPVNLAGKNRSLVGLGSYYVNGPSDCVGCHTSNTGFLGGGNNFGPVTTRNLTPDENGRPAGLTLEEFRQAIRFGTDFKNLAPPGPLIIMPWLAYRHGTDRYIEAIYEYLRSIPCVEGGPGVPANRCS